MDIFETYEFGTQKGVCDFVFKGGKKKGKICGEAGFKDRIGFTCAAHRIKKLKISGYKKPKPKILCPTKKLEVAATGDITFVRNDNTETKPAIVIEHLVGANPIREDSKFVPVSQEKENSSSKVVSQPIVIAKLPSPSLREASESKSEGNMDILTSAPQIGHTTETKKESYAEDNKHGLNATPGLSKPFAGIILQELASVGLDVNTFLNKQNTK